MSANVRRLVLDPAPILQNGIGLFCWVIIGGVNAAWMFGKSVPNIMLVFSTSAVALNYMLKARIWLSLPLSRKELGRAQWWYLWGRQMICAVLALAIAFGVAACLGRVEVSALDVLAVGASEICLIVLTGLAPLLASILRPILGTAGHVIGLGLPFGVALVLGWRWIGADAVTTLRPEMLTGGASALALSAVFWVLSPWLPMAQPNLLANSGARPAKVSVERPVAGAMRGWWVLVAVLTDKLVRVLVLLAVVVLALSLGGRRLTLGKLPIDGIWLLYVAPMLVTLIAMIYVPLLSQRVLAGLPLSAGKRATAMHIAAPLMQVPVLVLIVILVAWLRPEDMSVGAAFGYGLTLLAATAMVSMAIPVGLRFGQKGPAIVIVLFSAFWGMSAGFAVALGANDAHPFGLDIAVAAPILAGGLVVLLFAGWTWTWVELAYGRAAYRHRPFLPMTWRGQGA